MRTGRCAYIYTHRQIRRHNAQIPPRQPNFQRLPALTITRCAEVIRNTPLEDIDAKVLVEELGNKSMASVPDAIRFEIIDRITNYLAS